jgi:hypothetical protein
MTGKFEKRGLPSPRHATWCQAQRARRVPWERFSDLARQPLGRRAAGHRKPQQLPTFVAENKKCEELLKRNRRDHEKINRPNPLHMIAQEGLPSLQRPIPPRYHVDGNRGLGHRDAEFEQFAVNLGSAPQRVLKNSFFGSARVPLGRSAVGHRASGISIASSR